MNNNASYSVLFELEEMSSQFTKTDWKVYQFIKNNLKRISSLTASTIAEKIDASDASVIRFCQKVGFSGFYELRYKIQKELELMDTEKSINDYSYLFLKDATAFFEQFYAKISLKDIYKLKNKIFKADKFLIIGNPSDQHLIAIIAQKFLNIGMFAQVITDSNTLDAYTNLIGQNDLCIIIDEANQFNDIIHHLKTFKEHGTYMVSLSNKVLTDNDIIWDQKFILPQRTVLKMPFNSTKEFLILYFFDLIFFASFNENLICTNS